LQQKKIVFRFTAEINTMKNLIKETLRPILIEGLETSAYFWPDKDRADHILSLIPDELPKNLIGRKVKGWKFIDRIDLGNVISYPDEMNLCLGKEGEIKSYEKSNNSFYVAFSEYDGWSYPASEIHQHLLPEPPDSYYQPLFDLLEKEHGLFLLESEMSDIISVVRGMDEPEPKQISKRDVLEWDGLAEIIKGFLIGQGIYNSNPFPIPDFIQSELAKLSNPIKPKFTSVKEFVSWLIDNEGKILADGYGRKWKYEKYGFLFKDIGDDSVFQNGLHCVHLFGTVINNTPKHESK
jgi:hypothetical protein